MTKDVLNDDDGDQAGFDLGFATRAILGGQATTLAPAGTRGRTIPLCGRLIDDHDRIGSSSTKQGDISIAANAGLASNLAGLEGAEAGLVSGSGLAALTTLFRATTSPGDRVLVQKSACTATTALMQATLSSMKVEMAVVDFAAELELQNDLNGRTRLVYLQTPSDPLSGIVDITAVCAQAHEHGLTVAVDNTFASPVLQRPIEHGADVVFHSFAKYINGHGDAVGGGVFGDRDLILRMQEMAAGIGNQTGLNLDAAHLIQRGLKTLALRMEKHSSSAHAVALTLESHPAVNWVRYPFLSSHPYAATARRQMTGGSGMIAFGLNAGDIATRHVVERLRLFRPSIASGEVGSLVCTSADLSSARNISLEGSELCETLGQDVIRLSVGLEDAEDLVEDLFEALSGL
ncbi:Cystathionine gamma-synthase (plasmid) [Rhizobium leguminosarum bv. trifolii WSM2304]|uniref:Cystathionine gamma-synthase n=1 Tax=Rhizobium leguminosarum bv. trifolii (strain WSM2304) TaxID=395492 RepID=A0ABF7QVV6_RHILW|nr:PLP-dependent transferase [Rhizobium leguminosarum]ACI58290.1 Cystathionine gamma-synthase [Rhizobium leguminosarum bv. trifolii WSM2304]